MGGSRQSCTAARRRPYITTGAPGRTHRRVTRSTRFIRDTALVVDAICGPLVAHGGPPHDRSAAAADAATSGPSDQNSRASARRCCHRSAFCSNPVIPSPWSASGTCQAPLTSYASITAPAGTKLTPRSSAQPPTRNSTPARSTYNSELPHPRTDERDGAGRGAAGLLLPWRWSRRPLLLRHEGLVGADRARPGLDVVRALASRRLQAARLQRLGPIIVDDLRAREYLPWAVDAVRPRCVIASVGVGISASVRRGGD
jgi:hypothetical protein